MAGRPRRGLAPLIRIIGEHRKFKRPLLADRPQPTAAPRRRLPPTATSPRRARAVARRSTPPLAAAIAETLRDVTKMHGEAEFVKPGALPNDGKVIEDAKKYD